MGPWLCPLPALGLEPMNVSELPSVHLSNRDSKHLPHLFVLKIKSDHACQAQDWHISHTISNIWAFFFIIFCANHFLKSLLSLLQHCFCFGFWPRGMWDVSSSTRNQTATSVLESESVSHSVMSNSLLSQGL